MINRILLYNSGGGIGDALQILPLINALRNEFISEVNKVIIELVEGSDPVYVIHNW